MKMGKSIKLKNDNYLDSTSIVHKKVLLSDVLKNIVKIKTFTGTVTVNGTSANGINVNIKYSGYTPLGVVGIKSSDNYLELVGFHLDTSTQKCEVRYVNYGSRTITNNYTLTILYVKQ